MDPIIVASLNTLFSEPVSTLLKVVISVAQTTANFKPELELLDGTLQNITSIIEDTVNINRGLDRREDECKKLVEEIRAAGKLVLKCSKVKWNLYKRYKYSPQLKDFNARLLRFFNIDIQAIQLRGIVETLKGVDDMKSKVYRLASDVDEIRRSGSSISNSSGSMLRSRGTEPSGRENIDRKKYGWRVPPLPKEIVAFDEPLANLKAEVINGDDGSVLVVAAAGGCGKTTLVKMLCHDPEILGRFGENIFFVTVSERPNFMVIVNDLFNPNFSNPQVQFQSNEDAKNKLEIFLNENASGPMLLVLDDVWSDSFIENFSSNNRECKIVVTSRTAFQNQSYDLFQFDPLNDNDAKTLFCRSAFTKNKAGKKPSPNIDENLVNQMVKCCKRHPLTLSVVGRSLNGKDTSVWEDMLNSLSKGRLVLDLHQEVLARLERSFEGLDDELKECFLDLGMFLEDQRIPVTALLDMWVHMYSHDDGGRNTMAKVFELSYRCLLDIMASGFKDDLGERVNHCNQHFVTQHDLLRELAIHLNDKLALQHRSRLIINAQVDDFQKSIEKVQEPMQARILSISTGESFTSKWWHMEAPDLEVLILNLMSKTYTLPPFLAGNPNLKILNITNHGLYPTEFHNFDFLASSHDLTRIRLERVTISPSILSLQNLQKVSFVMCKIDDSFKKLVNTKKCWPQLVEIEIDYCQDLVEFPRTLCNSDHLKIISITNCNELCKFSEEIGDSINLETLSLRSCTKLEKLPESICRLEKLSVLDISDCLSLSGLPEKMGELSGLRTIYMKGCTGVHELPESVEELSHVNVVCNEEIAYQWQGYSNVVIDLVEEDRLGALMKICL